MHYDKSLYASFNKDTKRQAHQHRRAVAKLDPNKQVDEHQAQRSHRKTINILRIGGAKDAIAAMSKDSYWSKVIEVIVKQKIRDQKALVERLQRKF